MNLVKTEKDRFLAIDGNAIIHRAYHAYPSNLQTDEGIQVNAVYGFTVMLLEALKIFEPKYVFCAFDTKAPTFRHDMFPEYKGTRKATDQSLIDQFSLVEEVLNAFNIPIIKKEGYEADDILGTISKINEEGKWSEKDMELYILSGDKDLLQLVRGDTQVCLPAGSFRNLIAYDRQTTYDKLGIYPEQIIDYKALAGDSSDNIPGVKGIGDKTVVELFGKYGDMDTVYKNLTELKPRWQKLLGEGIEQAELSRELATINQDVDIDLKLESCVLRDFDRSRLIKIFKHFKFRTLIPKIEELFGREEQKVTSQLDIFSTGQAVEVKWGTQEEFNENVEKAQNIVIAYISIEESGEGKPFYLVRFNQKDNIVDLAFENLQLPDDSETVFYNWEYIAATNDSADKVDLERSLDILLFSHLIGTEKKIYNLNDLAFEYTQYAIGEKVISSDITNVLNIVEESRDKLLEKANEIKIYPYTKQSLEQYFGVYESYLLNSLRKIEMPTSLVLAKMEKRGIGVNIEYLKELNEDIQKQISSLTQKIYDSIGHEFNINSPKQLGDVLFNELGLEYRGKMSTKESVLKGLVGAHPVIELILQYREITKIHSTYTQPLLELANSDNAIHTDYKQTGTTSGRFSSVNPNMQNIPAQGEWAEKVRKIFVARENHKLIGIDYSQMELRIMADIANDDLLIKDFIDKIDVHSATAARILDKKIEDVTKKERSMGKTVNFGILFGQTPFGLSKMLGIERHDAAEYIRMYFETYAGVEEYIRNLEREAYKRGFVQTMFGTTRNVPALKSKNVRARYAAQREAINMPIQGGEADIMKLVMIALDDLIESKYFGKAHILLQVHDEFVFEAEEDIAEQFEKEALEIMQNTVVLNVPLDVSASIGNNLAEIK